jgi:prolyl oligopeptidase
MRALSTITLSLAALSTLPAWAADLPSSYPATQRQDVADTLHGTVVPDPYRWLEDDNASQTKEWIEAQNRVTFAFLESVPQRKAIQDRLTKLWNYERFGTPFKEGGRYFWSRNDGLQPQSVIFTADSLTAEPRVLMDPNTLSKDGTVALSGSSVSKDGKFWAYGVTDAGSDWNTWRVRSIADGKDLSDELKWVKFSGASWTKDGTGFFYNRYDEPKQGGTLTQVNRFPKVFFHKVGTPQSEDILVYERPDQPEWGFGAGVTDDGQYLVLNVSKGTDRKNRFFFRDLGKLGIAHKPTETDERLRKFERDQGVLMAKALDDKTVTAEARQKIVEGFDLAMKARSEMVARAGGSAHGFVELLNDFDASYDFVDNDGPVFWFLTDLDAPRGRLIAIDTRNPARDQWKTVIPQDEQATLTSVSVVGENLIANYLKDAASEVRVYDLTGKLVRKVDLPGIGTASGFSGKRGDPETFYTFTSFTFPPTIFRYDVSTGQSTEWRRPKVDFNPADYETKQVFFTSKDGTKVPMFITHMKGLKLDGTNPTHLYGYGGFNISITPSFSVANLVWMEMGGIYAVANIRGGGEYGEKWHKSGTKLQKQNVFDDFIAAAEWLIDNKYTKPEKLAISGRSNGGLLVGAVMAQRPELFAAALPGVGVMDMLRFHRFTIGWAWKSDYGSPDSPEEFKALNAYSPYHAMLRAKPGTKFPATMVITADHDDRVVPGHSHKFAAALQAAGSPDGSIDWQRPLLIRVETRAGHGAGRPIQKVIEEAADMWAFLVRTLDFTPTIPGQTQGAFAEPAAGAAPVAMAAVPARLSLRVEGMKCVMCSGKVTKLVKAVPGVKDCSVNLDDKLATIELDAAQPADAAALIKALADSGYQATLAGR